VEVDAPRAGADAPAREHRAGRDGAGRDGAGPDAYRAEVDAPPAGAGAPDRAGRPAAADAPRAGADAPAREHRAGRDGAGRDGAGRGASARAGPDVAGQAGRDAAGRGASARAGPDVAGQDAAGRRPVVPVRADRAGPAPAGRDHQAPAGWRGSAPAGHPGQREPGTGERRRRGRRRRLHRYRHQTAGVCRHRGAPIAVCPRRLATRSRHDSSPPRPWRSASTRGPLTGPRVLWRVRRRAGCSTSPHFLMFTLMFTRARGSHPASAAESRPQVGDRVLHSGGVGRAKGSLHSAPLRCQPQAVRLSTQVRTATRCRTGWIVSDRAIGRADDSVESALVRRATANHTGTHWYNAWTCLRHSLPSFAYPVGPVPPPASPPCVPALPLRPAGLAGSYTCSERRSAA
jgi:hypothetical protein